MTDKKEQRYSNPEALRFHEQGLPGKVSIAPTKALLTQRDLALAYSPGVAAPCYEIADNPDNAYKYTAKGNFVAVISNGTAILGLGDLGALASKPVMEGKSVLFKRFADIDSVDVEVDTKDPEQFINAVRYLGPTWGGINLEDIKAPECFYIEKKLKELMDIPVFHDDQHGTAIVTAAALINACKLTNRKFEDLKLVVLGAGSAGIACLKLVKSMGVKNALLVDRTGVIYKGRTEGMNESKEEMAIETTDRTLDDALKNADAFYGLSGKGAVKPEQIKLMAKNPIIFAMANPDPEITPAEARVIRSDAIIATGRSDYPNQVNNVLGFPYIFRGALDVHAKTINEEMKIAAANALAELARESVPQEVLSAYKKDKIEFGPEYIIPSPFDPRLISTIPVAVAKAAIDSGVARKKITDWDAYKTQLAARLNPTANTLSLINKKLRSQPKTVIFAEGEEEKAVRAAVQWKESGYGNAVLVGDESIIKKHLLHFHHENDSGIKIIKANGAGDRNAFASELLMKGEGDILLTGLTYSYNAALRSLMKGVGAKKGERVFGVTVAVGKNNKTIFISDTAVHIEPNAEQLAKITEETVKVAEKLGDKPRAALIAFSNFGNPEYARTSIIRDALKILRDKKVKFEVDGDMMPDTAMNPELQKLYPEIKLSGPANVLIMPSLEAANISGKILREHGGGLLIGPILCGFAKPAQIVPNNCTVSEMLNIAAIASVE
jgi:malate dehydrogenase (oxaloacetate-decarboxylating)(NADP+)